MKMFLLNAQNKEQLCELLLRVWTSAEAVSRLKKCGKSLFVLGGKVFELFVHGDQVQTRELHELYSNQEESDTRVILYLRHAEKLGHESAIVRTPDSDLFFLLLYHSHHISLRIFLDVGVGKHRKIVDVSDLASSFGKEYCSTLLGFYVFTGEDCTSAFKGKGKVGPLKKLQKQPKFQKAFANLGEEWTVSEDLLQCLEAFTCLIYGYPRIACLNEVRVQMLKKMVGEDDNLTSKSKVDISRLPPCKNAHTPHVQRVNYCVALYKTAPVAIIEKPKPTEGHGWLKIGDHIEPQWSLGPILPPSLVDVLEMTYHETVEDEEDVFDELNYEDLLEYLDDDDD